MCIYFHFFLCRPRHNRLLELEPAGAGPDLRLFAGLSTRATGAADHLRGGRDDDLYARPEWALAHQQQGEHSAECTPARQQICDIGARGVDRAGFLDKCIFL